MVMWRGLFYGETLAGVKSGGRRMNTFLPIIPRQAIEGIAAILGGVV